MKKYLLIIALIFTGCSYKTMPIIVGFKYNNFSINDQGFLKENVFEKKIEVYQAGNLAFVMRIKNDQICINDKCYNKTLFIHNLNSSYPSNLFETILSLKPFKNVKTKKIKNGFIQINKYFIYKVIDNRAIFKDKHKKFLFFYKKIK